jgi:hypothetical protein
MKDSDILKRLNYVTALGNEAIANQERSDFRWYVPAAFWSAFRAAGLNLIVYIYGTNSPYYTSFQTDVNQSYVDNIESGINILKCIKYEIDNGWLGSFKSLIAAEVFSSFLEMSEHLLHEGYKDAAAVMIGSVLEEHLRQLCIIYKVTTTILKGDDEVAKKADTLNGELKKADAYGLIQQKLVTAWLGLRNSAAHGKYEEYTKAQVELMYSGVLNFIVQTKS